MRPPPVARHTSRCVAVLLQAEYLMHLQYEREQLWYGKVSFAGAILFIHLRVSHIRFFY